MAFDSEDKRNDFAAWAEEMSYEEEKEMKRMEKQQKKEAKKAEKAAKKEKKKNKDSEEIKTESEDSSKEDNKGAEDSEKSEITDVENKDSEKDTSEKDASEKDASEKDASEKDESEEEYNPDYKKEKKPKKKEEVNIVKELLSLIIYIGVVIILCYCIIEYVGQRTTVNGRSMENTLQDGDNLWIDKFTYHFKSPERFDVIVFPYEDDVYYIKRVIGLPGETVQILKDGAIVIDGKVLVESYGKEVIMDSGTATEPLTLGEDEYFVMGDNRNDSRDSRWADVGNINKSDIIGKAVFRLTPFSKFGKID